MYLKSLTLKGFKSFADRSVLSLEPGITAVVGPNGSGKSNISDAVLWVLGERNAKNLRGQAMEDVIFAGSSARKSVGVAEVELVLDNTDHTLSVEYDEVAITRRVYRTGESEYLINGVVARRLDVLDILHDSGLGTGTHSIISQGSLDSILQSKPEDRRMLIEEAAGVLKHKQRKAKSERKLANMDLHLMRVRDVAQEVRRQLGPLERKAAKARDYKELSSQLAEIDLALAVSNLRDLQQQWAQIEEREEKLLLLLEEKKRAATQAEQVVEALQQRIQQETIDAGVLADKHRRASLIVERIDGVERVLHEKKRAAKTSEADYVVSLESNTSQLESALTDKLHAENQLKQSATHLLEYENRIASLKSEFDQALGERKALEQELDKLERATREDKRTLETLRKELIQTQEALANGLAHMRLIEGHRKELEGQMRSAQADEEKMRSSLERIQIEQQKLSSEEAEARSCVGSCISERDEAKTTLDAKREELLGVTSEIKGLEEVERALNATNAARSWLLDNLESFTFSAQPLSRVVRAEEGFEALVEYVLGNEISALVVDDATSIMPAIEAVQNLNKAGEVVLFTPTFSTALSHTHPSSDDVSAWGELLINKITYPEIYADQVQTLLGNIVVCDTPEMALRGCRESSTNLRFVTRSLAVFDSSGRVSLGTVSADTSEGVLARARRLEAMQHTQKTLEDEVAALTDVYTQAEKAVRTAQEKSLDLSQRLASLKGQLDAATSDLNNAEQKTMSLMREYEACENQHTQAEETVAKARPSVEAQEEQILKLEESLAAMQTRADEATDQVVPLRKKAAQLRDSLSDVKLKVATLTERKTYASRMVQARELDVKRFKSACEEARVQLAKKAVAQKRIDPLMTIFDELIRRARARTQEIELQATTSQSSSASLHAEVTLARTVAHSTREALDATNASLSEVKVEKGRLEVQVDGALKIIVDECGVPLDHALRLPVLENREETLNEADKLKRRIKSLGAINLDAASEYDQLKQRYDYLASQLDDLETARRSLEKIVHVIDRRMKDDFVRTFDEVNKNFKEIFATLFPGGSARLSLLDPDNIETSGIEVSAQPRGKRITKMMLMSGGEKSLTALALLFAVYRIRTTPFYVLDEVEAALDDSNLRRLTAYLQTLRASTQLIMITHQRRTMEMADVLFGVSMQSDGITKVVSQKLDRALQYALD